MKQWLYIETSVISYLAARSNPYMVLPTHQAITRQWWESKAVTFELRVSELVAQEAAQADADASTKRMSAIEYLLTWNCRHPANRRLKLLPLIVIVMFQSQLTRSSNYGIIS